MSSNRKLSYGLMDKSSGVQVGIVILGEGQDIPDLSQMELKICESETPVAEEQDEATQQTFKTSNNCISNENHLQKNERLVLKSESLVPKNESLVSEKKGLVLNQSFISMHEVCMSKSEGPTMTNKTEPLQNIVSQLVSVWLITFSCCLPSLAGQEELSCVHMTTQPHL
jgi:hypothetical protein